MKIQMAFLACLLAVTGCASKSGGQSALSEAADAVVSTVSGGHAGSGKVSSAIMGELRGGLVGGVIGSDLNRTERGLALEAEYRALEYTPSGQVVAWGDRQSGRFGEVVAGSPYRVGSQDCRQYGHTVFVDGKPKKARGTACRNTDGSWTLLS